jgi:hypothetical protein
MIIGELRIHAKIVSVSGIMEAKTIEFRIA